MALPITPNPYGIELVEGETIEFTTKRHWMLLAYHLALPVIGILVAAGLAAYRWYGGQFFVLRSGPHGLIDSFNAILFACAVVCLIGMAVYLRRKKLAMVWALGLVMLLFAALFGFRYIGGRVFVINPFEASGIDLVNRFLIGSIILLLLVCAYLWVDWRNDTIVLTNRRVVHDRRDLFQRHLQDQIEIPKIEKVTASKRTYLTHWLDYGALIIQATSVGRRMILEMADEPSVMADKINAKVKQHQNTRSESHFATMVDEYVYKEKVRKPIPPVKLRVRQSSKMLNWLFFENPEVNDEKGEIIWYAHWIFVFASVLLPFTIFLAGLLLLLISIRVSFIVGPWAALVGFLLLAACGLWGLWRYKDTTDDFLQLTPTNVIKLNKLPFGPERRQTASLGAIKNISFRSTFIGRMIGYGSVEIQTAGADTKMTIHEVPDPREIVATIYEYMAEFKANERERTLNDTLTLMHYFHEVQDIHGELYKDSAPPSSQAAT